MINVMSHQPIATRTIIFLRASVPKRRNVLEILCLPDKCRLANEVVVSRLLKRNEKHVSLNRQIGVRVVALVFFIQTFLQIEIALAMSQIGTKLPFLGVKLSLRELLNSNRIQTVKDVNLNTNLVTSIQQ